MKVGVTLAAVGPTASTLQYQATKFDIWALGITIVLGGQLFSWNAGLLAGILSNAVAILVLGVGYVCLVLSMAEMTSTLAFSGGAYGLTRCSIGFYAGWVIGCCEALEYMAYTASAVLTLSDMLYIAFPTLPADMAPLLWLMTYAVCNLLLATSDRMFWLVNRFLALVSLVLVLVYLGGAYSLSEFSHRVTSDDNRLVVGGGVEFLRRLPFAAWFFVGIEALSTVCNVVPTPKDVIPFGQVACVLTLFVLAVLVFAAAIGVAPDVTSITTDVAVLSRGYERMLHLSAADAMMLSIPATFATIFGFVLAYSNILAAMASSRLLPLALTRQFKWSHTHPIATLLGSLLGFGMCFLVREFETLRDELFNIGMVLAFTAYAAQCVGYMYLKQRFAHLPRAFQSPLGVHGALLSLSIWLINIVSVLAFQDNVAYKLQVLAGLLLLQSVYYHLYAKHKQQMSDDERKVLFFAHVANVVANDAKRKMHRKSRGRMSSTIERAAGVLRRIVVWPHAALYLKKGGMVAVVGRRVSSSHIDDERKRYKASATDMWALSTVLTLGGLVHGWAAGAASSLAAQIVSLGLVGAAYVSLTLGMAEVSSALPFGGGVFGLSRCSLGYFIGFVVGACECLYYVLYTSALTLTLGDLLAPTIGADFVPLVWFGTYAWALLFHILQNRWFWHVTAAVVVLGLGLLALYCAGVWRALHDDIAVKAASSDSGWTILQLLPLYTTSFIGIDALSSFADHVQRPINVVPTGQARGSYSALIVSALVFAASAIVPPTTTAGGLTRGFQEVLRLDGSSAALVSLPLLLPAISAFVITSSNILTGLAKSSLVYRRLARPLVDYNCYPRTLVLCGLLSFGLAWLGQTISLVGRNLYKLSFLFAMPTYMAHAYGYLYLSAKFPGHKRAFVSPLGRIAGVYAICIFGLCWVSLLICQDDSLFLALVALTSAGVLTVYYHCHAKRHQSLSEDERKIFFFAHIRQRNEAANHHRRRRPSNDLWLRVQSRRIRELIQLHGAPPKPPRSTLFGRLVSLSSSESRSRERHPRTRVVPYDAAQPTTTTRPAAPVAPLQLQSINESLSPSQHS